ncbi:hypothetical protein [Kiloniella laminariae]|uniref:hypothetical protein n=1 Tax=Kiloniella laminariae TaxID=454162 RepID=UPI00037B8EB9|nr:hypothetical protein [Kiloniella laminariae]
MVAGVKESRALLTALDAVSAMSSNEYKLLRNLPVLLLRPDEYCLGDAVENSEPEVVKQPPEKQEQGYFVESCVASAMARQQSGN